MFADVAVQHHAVINLSRDRRWATGTAPLLHPLTGKTMIYASGDTPAAVNKFISLNHMFACSLTYRL